MTPCPLLSWRSRGSLASDQVPSTPQAHLGHGLALSLDAASARPAGGGPALGDGLDHTPPSRGLGHPDQGLRRPSSQTPHPLHHVTQRSSREMQPAAPPWSRPSPRAPGGTGSPGEHPFKANGSFLSRSDFSCPFYSVTHRGFSPAAGRRCWQGRPQGRGSVQGVGHFLLPGQTPRRTPERFR